MVFPSHFLSLKLIIFAGCGDGMPFISPCVSLSVETQNPSPHTFKSKGLCRCSVSIWILLVFIFKEYLKLLTRLYFKIIETFFTYSLSSIKHDLVFTFHQVSQKMLHIHDKMYPLETKCYQVFMLLMTSQEANFKYSS